VYNENVYLKGRFDIQLMPHISALPGFLIEVKTEKDCSSKELEDLSQNALRQIMDRQYDVEMRAKGIKKIYNIGIAFSGKDVRISTN
jgi:hypothetical protein